VATPGTHFSFSGWSEGTGSISCTGTGACGPFHLEANSSVKATFPAIKHTLGITVVGTGEVKCKVNGAAATTCAAEYNEGTELELVATPGTHFSFSGWSEGTGSISCTGTGACGPFHLEANSSVKAAFIQITHTLTVATAGTGSGAVECKFGAGSFGSCSGPHNEGEAVTVKAAATSGSSFAGYSAGTGSATTCNGVKAAECTFNLESDSTLTATFTNFIKLSVSRSGTGSGTITSVPGGINCGSACEAEFALNTIVTLEPSAASGSVFVEWTGACAGSGFCHVEMTAAKTVGAVFAKVQRALTVTKAGSGGGSVSCDGGACAAGYPDGTTVTLTATPDSSSTFGGWSGAGCSGTGSCQITLTADAAVTATFDKKAEPTPTPAPEPTPPKEGTAKAPEGSAPVQGNQAQIKLSCGGGGACEGTLKLYAKVKQGKKHKNVVVGKSSFKIAAGKSKTIKVKITNGQIKSQLKKGHTVKVQLKGSGLKNRTIKLKPKKKGKNNAAARVERRRVGHHR
jgi:hypothetical protein